MGVGVGSISGTVHIQTHTKQRKLLLELSKNLQVLSTVPTVQIRSLRSNEGPNTAPEPVFRFQRPGDRIATPGSLPMLGGSYRQYLAPGGPDGPVPLSTDFTAIVHVVSGVAKLADGPYWATGDQCRHTGFSIT